MAHKISGNQNSVGKLYQSVIDDVINNIREAFLDDGVDEQVLQELKSTWESKLQQSKAVDNPQPRMPTPRLPLQYVNPQPIIYHAVQDHPQNIRLTGPGQQAALALSNAVPGEYQLKLPTASQPQIYTQFQPARQVITHASNPQLVSQDQSKSSGTQLQPSAIIQTDGSSDDNVPCCSKDIPFLSNSKMYPQTKPECQKFPMDRSVCLKLKTRSQKLKKSVCISQIDGKVDTSSEEEDSDDDEDDDDDDDEEADGKESEPAVDEEPLCTDDDVTDEDPVELFDTDNVVVCQYDKINRTKSRWKFNLKVGIMNLNGSDMVFQKATGEAEW